jgi:dephospho-CoA kinase
MDGMKTIGLVGGVASGKSLVAKLLVELGAGLLDADRTGHAVLANDLAVQQAIRERWGDKTFLPDGTADRAAIARRVFAENDDATDDRKFLEALLHPRIGQRLNRLRQELAASGKPAVVLDAPLLLEAGWGSMCDVILMVESPREVRLERALKRGWTEAEFIRREAAQWSPEQKRYFADAVIPNTGSEDQLRRAVREFWEQYISPPAAAG